MAPTPTATATWKSKLGTQYPKELIDRLDAEHHRILKGLRSLPENRHCADCGALETNWASVNLGVFLCTRCASVHRGLGTHVSKVKSCMGTYLWGADEIARMREMGNGRGARVYLGRDAPRGLPGPDVDEASLKAFTQKKYEHRLWALPESKVVEETKPPAATKRTTSPEDHQPCAPATAGGPQLQQAARGAAVQRPTARPALQKPKEEQVARSAAPWAAVRPADPALPKPAQPTEAFFDDFFGSLFGEDQQQQEKEAPTLMEAFSCGFPEPALESPMPQQTVTAVAAAPGSGGGAGGGGRGNSNPFLFDPAVCAAQQQQQQPIFLEPENKAPAAVAPPSCRKVAQQPVPGIDWFEGW